MIRVLLDGETEEGRSFGGTTTLSAELTEDVVAELRMRAALERFARALLGQYARHRFRDNKTARVVGVKLHDVSFSLITKPETV